MVCVCVCVCVFAPSDRSPNNARWSCGSDVSIYKVTNLQFINEIVELIRIVWLCWPAHTTNKKSIQLIPLWFGELGCWEFIGMFPIVYNGWVAVYWWLTVVAQTLILTFSAYVCVCVCERRWIVACHINSFRIVVRLLFYAWCHTNTHTSSDVNGNVTH